VLAASLPELFGWPSLLRGGAFWLPSLTHTCQLLFVQCISPAQYFFLPYIFELVLVLISFLSLYTSATFPLSFFLLPSHDQGLLTICNPVRDVFMPSFFLNLPLGTFYIFFALFLHFFPGEMLRSDVPDNEVIGNSFFAQLKQWMRVIGPVFSFFFFIAFPSGCGSTFVRDNAHLRFPLRSLLSHFLRGP